MTVRSRTPNLIISDNGTNFVGAEKDICKKVDLATSEHQHIRWKFNPS